MRIERSIIAVLFALLFTLSCEQVITLDKTFSNAEGSTADEEKDTADGTAGNPAEDLAEGPDSPQDGSYADSAAVSDADTTAATDATAPASDEGVNGADEGTGMSDADTATLNDSYDEWSDAESVNDDDPTMSFSPDECGCGDEPIYEPICCDGTMTVFNKCFANCINYYSGKCASQQPGTCAVQGGENDADDDAIVETPDDDTIEIGDCGCVPEDLDAWCCDGGDRYIGQCTASCSCEGEIALCN